ncbi:hypothetical protein BDR26DRAFT_848900 [Obelidium mucronatum]|nr:hypothetical protein BDR26DRAFT_848900 [Obelidium mucronatum]
MAIALKSTILTPPNIGGILPFPSLLPAITQPKQNQQATTVGLDTQVPLAIAIPIIIAISIAFLIALSILVCIIIKTVRETRRMEREIERRRARQYDCTPDFEDEPLPVYKKSFEGVEDGMGFQTTVIPTNEHDVVGPSGSGRQSRLDLYRELNECNVEISGTQEEERADFENDGNRQEWFWWASNSKLRANLTALAIVQDEDSSDVTPGSQNIPTIVVTYASTQGISAVPRPSYPIRRSSLS